MITPEGGFKLEADEIYVLPDGIEANLRPIKLMPGETRIEYITILSLWNPRRKSKKTDPFAFLMPKDCTSEGTKITFRLDEDGTALVKKYRNKMVFLAAVTRDKENNILRWTNTLGKNS